MEDIVYFYLAVIAIIVGLWIYDCYIYGSEEGFFGGYYYPYDYPYYWPWFYSGCNEDVFGNVRCLPGSAHPFW